MYRELQTAVSSAIRNELGIRPRLRRLQLRQNILIAFPGKRKHPPEVLEADSLVGEGVQFVRQSQLADTRADVVHGAEQVSQVGNRRNACAAPGIRAPASGDSGQKKAWGVKKIFRRCRKRADRPSVSRQNQSCQPETPLDRIRVIGQRQLGKGAV